MVAKTKHLHAWNFRFSFKVKVCLLDLWKAFNKCRNKYFSEPRWRRQWATFHLDGPDEKGLWIIQSAVAYKKFIEAIVCVADYLQ